MNDFFTKRKRYFQRKPSRASVPNFDSIKLELDEHREAINANSMELQESYSCLGDFNNKLDKLNERLEKIEVFLQMHCHFAPEQKPFDVKPLTKQEQQVFLVIYALEDEKGLVSSADIAKKTGLPHYLVAEYIARLVQKGIPLIKKYINNASFLKLNPEFKRVQAMENILQIDSAQRELVGF